MKRILMLLPLSLLAMLPAFSHEGHGHISSKNPLHYIAEPLHALVLVVVLAVVGYGIFLLRRQKKQS